jgi:NAD(P)H-hydrate epimerase
MEAAGWQLARHCRGQTAVVCGRGNNGGDGLAAARHLHRWGRLHSVCCINSSGLTHPAADEAAALLRLGVTIGDEIRLEGAQVILDALLGTGLSRPPVGKVADWISAINAAGTRVVAVDIPSGLDTDTGRAYEPAVRATVTVTLGLPKPGLLTGEGPAHAGEVWVADIGVPNEAYALLGVDVPSELFAMQDRFRL